jgi:hypothetical protein
MGSEHGVSSWRTPWVVPGIGPGTWNVSTAEGYSRMAFVHSAYAVTTCLLAPAVSGSGFPRL